MTQREMYNYVLIHTARTWERIRVTQKHQEMPLDNISSVEAIIEVADAIFDGAVIQGFLNASQEKRENDYWVKNTEEGMSDSFIEAQAEKIIRENYSLNKN